MQRMPYPKYIDDKYLVALQSWLPFVLLISYIYPAINIVKSVVYEKEKKLKVSVYLHVYFFMHNYCISSFTLDFLSFLFSVVHYVFILPFSIYIVANYCVKV